MAEADHRERWLTLGETALVILALQAYLLWRPSRSADLLAMGTLAVIVALLLRRRGESLRSLGVTDFAAHRRALAPLGLLGVTIVAGAVVWCACSGAKRGSYDAKGLLLGLAIYPLWGLAQQLLYLGFVWRGLLRARVSVAVATTVTTLAFGFVHFPNWPLVALTAPLGFAFAVVYQRAPALLLIALVHGIAGALALKLLGLNLEIGALYRCAVLV